MSLFTRLKSLIAREREAELAELDSYAREDTPDEDEVWLRGADGHLHKYEPPEEVSADVTDN